MYASNEVRTGAFPRTYFNTSTATLIASTQGYGADNSFDRSQIGDNNVTITNSFKMYHALKDNGVPVEFVAYPVHGHFPGDP